MGHTTLIKLLHFVTLFDQTLTFTLYDVHAYIQASSSPETTFGKFCFSAVISPVLVADKTKGDDFDLLNDL